MSTGAQAVVDAGGASDGADHASRRAADDRAGRPATGRCWPATPATRSPPAASGCARCSSAWPPALPRPRPTAWSARRWRSSWSTARPSSTTTCSTARPCAAAAPPSWPPADGPRPPPPGTCSSRAPSPSWPAAGRPSRSGCSRGPARELALGELTQREDAFKLDVSVARYLARCRLKTAVLFRAACELGAIEADGDPEALGAFGERIGLAFQILDDVLDVTGPPGAHGQAARRGSARRHGDPAADPGARPRTPSSPRSICTPCARPRTPPECADRIAATGALDAARSRARELVAEAKLALPALPDRQRGRARAGGADVRSSSGSA